MNNNRVMIVSGHLNHRTGFNSHSRLLYDFLEKSNMEPIYCSVSASGHSRTTISKDYRYYDVNQNHEDSLYRIIKAESPAVVISFEDLWRLSSVAAIKSVYPFYWIHHFLAEEDNLSGPLVGRDRHSGNAIDLKAIISLCDFIVPANLMVQEILKTWNLPGFAYPVYPFIAHPNIGYNLKNRKRIREKFGLTDNDYLYIVVARNFPRKNIPVVLQAFADIKKRTIRNGLTPKLYIHTLPSTAMGWDLSEISRCNGGNDGSIILRDMNNYDDEITDDDIEALYSGADCLINPSFAEGLGYPVMEAMLAECPVVVSSGGYPKYYVPGDGGNEIVKPSGYMYPYGGGFTQRWVHTDPADMADSMFNMINNGHIRLKKNKKAIETHFNNKITGTILKQIVEEFVRRYNEFGVSVL